MPSLKDLPNEILFQIFLLIPPESAPALQRVSKKFNNIAQPLLWRHYCQDRFKYWSPSRRIKEKLSRSVNETDWKALFQERCATDRQIAREIDSILLSQDGRIPKAEAILRHGWDAKDALLRGLEVDDDAEDVLARRYYTNRVLQTLHRATAIEEWAKLADGQEVPLERALGAFDLFFWRDGMDDLDGISRRLDSIADKMVEDSAGILEDQPIQKGIKITSYLRSHDLVSIRGDIATNYYNMQNSLIGIALRGPDHSSLPLVSVAIFCSVARRLGLNAYPCGFPGHVFAMFSPTNDNLHDKELDSQEISEVIYLDPFYSADPVELGYLHSRIRDMGLASSDHRRYLEPCPTVDIVLRCASNIGHSTEPRQPLDPSNPTSVLNSSFGSEDAIYAAIWAWRSLTNGAGNRDEQHRQVAEMAQRVSLDYPYDTVLIERFVIHRMGLPEEDESFARYTGSVRRDDLRPTVPRRRAEAVNSAVTYRVGQVFRHKRYRYCAFIVGWDTECKAGNAWISQMQVNQTLARGQNQSFYHAQSEDGSKRYVAEDNIVLVKPGSHLPRLKELAGQWFKRWDEASGKFVSNIVDEYPDD